jgi:hypothetical protein
MIVNKGSESGRKNKAGEKHKTDCESLAVRSGLGCKKKGRRVNNCFTAGGLNTLFYTRATHEESVVLTIRLYKYLN